MAANKTNNLSIFLTDIADQIRANDGTTANINPQDFRTKISNTVGANVTKNILPGSVSTTASSGYSSRLSITPTTSSKYINIPKGYNGTNYYYRINAIAIGELNGDCVEYNYDGNGIPIISSSGWFDASLYVNAINIPASVGFTVAYNGGPTDVQVISADNGYPDELRLITIDGEEFYPFTEAGYFYTVTFSQGTSPISGSATRGTITPGTSNKYLHMYPGILPVGISFVIAGDANLTTKNIRKGVSVFGVTGASTCPDWEEIALPANCRYVTIKNNASSGTVRYNYYSSASAIYAGTTINAGAVSGALTVLSSSVANYGYLTIQVPSNAAAAGITLSFASSNNGTAIKTITLTGALLYTLRVSSITYSQARTLYVNKISG